MSDKTVRRPIKWRSCADTDVGTVREVNEDAVLSMTAKGVWAVADGMGGHEVGDVASNMIVRALEEVEDQRSLNEIVDAVEDCLIDVNHRMLEYADIMLDNRTIGSTIVTLIIRGRVGVCLWVGDSRLYRFRNNELLQLSRDHSQIEELVQQGYLKPEDAKYHPDSNVITRAIGVGAEVYVDINVFGTQIGDTFLLCSDGLYNAVEQDDIMNCMNKQDVEQGTDELLSKALSNGATDNVSLIIVKGVPDALGQAVSD